MSLILLVYIHKKINITENYKWIYFLSQNSHKMVLKPFLTVYIYTLKGFENMKILVIVSSGPE